jgi:hypothetical protein
VNRLLDLSMRFGLFPSRILPIMWL